MKHKSARVAIAVGTIALALALALDSSAHAGSRWAVSTPSLVPDPGGYLYCKVVATSTRPIGITAAIISDARTEVTEFGSGWRVSPAATDDGRFHAEQTAGSYDDSARYCKAVVKDARKSDVHVSLTAFDANGNPGATVEAR